MRYLKGFKDAVVRKTLEGTGRSINAVAGELGVYPATISQWIRQHKAGTLALDDGDSNSPNHRHLGEKLALLLESKQPPISPHMAILKKRCDTCRQGDLP